MTDTTSQQNNENNTPQNDNLFRFDGFAFARLKDQLIFWPIFVVGVVADIWTKYAVFGWLSESRHSTYTVIEGFFRIVLAENDGAAFGIASGQRYLLAGISVFALILILLIFLFTRITHKMMIIALAMFAAGICGNLYDRIFNDGRVRDFIDIVYWPGKHWPAFNIADSLLCVAMGLILISTFITEMSAQKRDQQQK